MKKVTNWMLMVALVCGLSLSVTSCKDDDDNNTSEQKKDDVSPLDTDDARVAFRWLCVLAGVDKLDDNWQSKQYEPIVGDASQNNAFTRIIVVKDLQEAQEDFSKLADKTCAQLASMQIIDGGAAGTMKWTPSKAGEQNLAVVEVNSRIMPHLQKLIYCTPDQKGENSWFGDNLKGTAYYRLGDVIRDQDGYLWVCVRPAFAPDKEYSHWINIYNASRYGNKYDATGKEVVNRCPMLEENVYDKYDRSEKYGLNVTIKLPTQLAYDREHIYNLNNLLWALLKPQAYYDAAIANKQIGLCGFNYDYHGKNFLAKVSQFWNEVPQGGYKYNIWEMLLGRSRDQFDNLQQMNFFYQGYKWWWGETPDFWIYNSKGYVKTLGETGSESGDKVTNINVVKDPETNQRGFDITRYAGDPNSNQYAGFKPQFSMTGNDVHEGYWVVRYKRGDKLGTKGSKYDPYNKISGCQDVYVYNVKTGHGYGADVPQEQDGEIIVEKPNADLPEVGYLIGDDGLFYKDEEAVSKVQRQAVAVVVCVNNATPVEAGTDYYGLAMAVEDTYQGEEYEWADEASRDKNCFGDGAIVSPEQRSRLAEVMNGLAVTTRLATHVCGAMHSHPAAENIYKMSHPILEDANKANFSRWFIPSSGQFIMACKSMGFTWNGTTFTGAGHWNWGGYKDMFGSPAGDLNGEYFTATASTNNNPSIWCFDEQSIFEKPMTTSMRMRPMMAFKKIK